MPIIDVKFSTASNVSILGIISYALGKTFLAYIILSLCSTKDNIRLTGYLERMSLIKLISLDLIWNLDKL